MTTERDVMDILACVECGGGVAAVSADEIICRACGRSFSRRNGVFSFLRLADASGSNRLWRKRLQFFKQWRMTQSAAPANPDIVPVKEMFARFANISGGAVLDIGCGGGDIRKHIHCSLYCGVDPIPLPPVDFPLFEGLGEHLPFKTSSFDCVIISQVLDHCVDPAATLCEASRVVNNRGKIYIAQYLFDNDRRFFNYLKFRLMRTAGLSDHVHSWETKTSRITSQSMRKLLSSLFDPGSVVIEEPPGISQLFAGIEVSK